MPGRPAILSLHQDRRGRMWVGTYRMGLSLFDPARRTFVPYRHQAGNAASLANDDVWVIADAEDDTFHMIEVTRENGSSRDPYPPTTVSLLTNPRFDFTSARITRIGHL